jgi:site-specific DNA-cytosine methylase
MPTQEEAQKIKARCDRCKIRGFKKCDGKRPHCDTCVRNKTTALCWRPRQKQPKLEGAPPANAEIAGRLEQPTIVTRPYRKRRNVEAEHTLDAATDDHLTGVIEPVNQSKSTFRRNRMNKVSQSLQQSENSQSHTFEDFPEQYDVYESKSTNGPVEHVDTRRQCLTSLLPIAHDLTLRSRHMDLDDGSPHADTAALGREQSDHDSLANSDVSFREAMKEKANSTDTTSITDDDEAQIQQELQRQINSPSVKTDTRPRRSHARISYIEPVPDVFSDHEMESGRYQSGDNESDAYESRASTPESVSGEELGFEELADEQSSAECDHGSEGDEEEIDIAIENDLPKARPKARLKHQTSGVQDGKGIDFNLPPISNIDDAFKDMTTKAIELGLADVMKNLDGRQINVATMCSGTESPLLAFELISRALEQTGNPPLVVHQKFAAEIEVFKQAFIERNQSPGMIFRDVRDFIPDNATTAITAYGAEERIPTGLDILIAGFVCKDLSRLNSQQKSLDDDGESGDTWRAIYAYSQRFRPSIVLLENVKGLSKLWNKVVSMWDKIGYEAAWLIRDTKRYRIPQTRERMYMIAIERKHFGRDAKLAVSQWQDLMEKLQRQCSSPYEAWLTNTLHETTDHNALVSEVDWALCKLRYDHIRSDERLGILRPVTKWSENGTLRPPSFANRPWYNSQSSRVYDAIDVAHLQAARKGYDSLYKMAVLDVSQNVDRFKTALGILPCITPGGCDFATNRQEALSGKQLLLLQGMPMSKLLFGTETQKECQDLAGNAMTTTVIGASILAALICGTKAFRYNASSEQVTRIMGARQNVPFVRPSSMDITRTSLDGLGQFDLAELRQDAIMSARLCNCEGDVSLCKSIIQVCSGCGHTACNKCAGNPKHKYNSSISRVDRSQTPNEFLHKWKPRLPMRLGFSTFPDIRQLLSASQLLDQTMTAYIDCVAELSVESQHYCFKDIVRQDHGWTVNYSSACAKLELRVGGTVEWLLFLDCPSELPGNNPLRKLFQIPIARAQVAQSLLDLKWEFRIPATEKHKLQISSSGPRYSSWRSRLGLLDYKNETVPVTLQVTGKTKKCKAFAGNYELLPECGTASCSLYKRSTSPDLYLFLDPSPLGEPQDDGFVFSGDCTRKHYGDARISYANIEPSWRPWHVENEVVHDIEVTIPDHWITASMTLELVDTALVVRFPSKTTCFGATACDCSRAIMILEVRLSERLPIRNVDDYSWVLERVKRRPSLSSWQSQSVRAVEDCACAPTYPRILWSVNKKGVATPHEARKAAAEFERAIKTRASIFHVHATTERGDTQIQVAVNIAALLHRAKGRLTHTGPVDTAWRLATDHADLPPEPFVKFRLLSNSDDPAFALPPAIAYLRNAQPRSLSWMKAQELGKEMVISEVEEAIHADLGWRAEARAQAKLLIRGGVLADLPSFGKTVTCIALIQSEFDEYPPEILLKTNKQLHAETEALVDSAATLIVCPPHIALQWQTELKKFLGKQYESYNVIVVQTFSQLQRLSIEDIQGSRVVVLSWSVFTEDGYISSLAYFTAMPEPNVTGRRAFATWFNQASQEIPRQLAALQSLEYNGFRDATDDLLANRLKHDDFKATLPTKVQHGSAYQSFNATQAKLKSQAKSKLSQSKRKASEYTTTAHQIPLLHLFRFNRVVVDEYHYLNNDKKIDNVLASVSVKRIAALKRWVLSGTPALANFSDVDQIASYLGIKLGRYYFGDGVETTQSERVRRSDQTLVEEFLSQTETLSRQWHKARHERAQEFLDLFVRQNEACLGHIACVESLVPVELDIGHHAVYLELSQYLISQKMQIKRLNNKLHSDKIDRLNASLSNSATAEDALLKSALLFKIEAGSSALDALTELRSKQRYGIQVQLRELMAGFEGLKKTDEISELYNRFKDDIIELNWLGDDDATRIARNLLIKAKKTPNSSAFSELRGTTQLARIKLSKKRLSNLRETACDLAHLIRSERFISAIQRLVGSLATGTTQDDSFACSYPDCDGTATLSQLRLITHCGHVACERCLSMRADADTCVVPKCNLFVQGVNLVKLTDLGSRTEPEFEPWFGRKMHDITQLISNFPKGDQGVVFAPNDETIEILEEALDCHAIPYHSLRGCKAATSAKIIEDFKTEDDPDQQSKVLILNTGSESAAGA